MPWAKIVSTVFIYLPCKLLLNAGYLDRCQPRIIALIRDVCRLECHFVPNVILETKLLRSTHKEWVKRPSQILSDRSWRKRLTLCFRISFRSGKTSDLPHFLTNASPGLLSPLALPAGAIISSAILPYIPHYRCLRQILEPLSLQLLLPVSLAISLLRASCEGTKLSAASSILDWTDNLAAARSLCTRHTVLRTL